MKKDYLMMLRRTCLLLTVVLSAFYFQTPAFAKEKDQSNVSENQNLKVRAIDLIGGAKHSEKKLERILIEELKKGWTYDYHVDIDSPELGYITKLFVFKKATTK